MKEFIKAIFSFTLLFSCALFSSAQEVVEVSAEAIPSSLKGVKEVKLTGLWSTVSFSQLKSALGTNAFLAQNTCLVRVDMSEAQMAENTSLLVNAGLSKHGVFFNCTALQQVVLPAAEQANNIVSLEKAFYNCKSLRTVDLSHCISVSSFNSAFYGCSALQNIDLHTNKSANTARAWQEAFSNCNDLKKVSLSAGFVTAEKVFAGCHMLQEIDWETCEATTTPLFYVSMFDEVPLADVVLKLKHPQYLLFQSDEKWKQLKLVDLAPEPSGDYIVDGDDIPNSLTRAVTLKLTGVWNGDKFNKLTLALKNNGSIVPTPNKTLVSLDMSEITLSEPTALYRKGFKEYGIFNNCTSLVEVIMPLQSEEAAKFTNLDMAFSGCSSLKELDLQKCSGITSLNKTFQMCSALEKVSLSSVAPIVETNSTFESCENLSEVILSATFPICRNTFAYCFGLRKIDWTSFVGNQVPQLTKSFFMGVEDLKQVTLSLKYDAYRLFVADADWSALTLVNTEPDKVVDLVVDASDIPNSLRQAVTLKLTGEWNSDKLNLLSLALGNNGGIFETSNTKLELLDMSEMILLEETPLYRQGIKEYGIFNNCTALKKVILPKKYAARFTSLKRAFKGCHALCDIDLSLFVGATDIDEAFKGTSITFADMAGWTSVRSTVSAFEDCASLKQVVLPEGFHLDRYVFANCVALQMIDFTAYKGDQEAPACVNNAFSGLDDLSLITLKVGENYSVFESHKIWSSFNISTVTGVHVTPGIAVKVPVYTLQGIYVGSYNLDENLKYKLPAPGIYLVNGRKFICDR